MQKETSEKRGESGRCDVEQTRRAMKKLESMKKGLGFKRVKIDNLEIRIGNLRKQIRVLTEQKKVWERELLIHCKSNG